MHFYSESEATGPSTTKIVNAWVVDTPKLDSTIADENCDEDNFGRFENHVEFIKLIRDAKETADRTNSKVIVNWRGYKTSVLPGLPPLTVKALKDRLIWALRGVSDLKDCEREVI